MHNTVHTKEQCCLICWSLLCFSVVPLLLLSYSIEHQKNGIKKKKFHIHCIEIPQQKSLSIPSQLFVLHYHRVAGYIAGSSGGGAIYY